MSVQGLTSELQSLVVVSVDGDTEPICQVLFATINFGKQLVDLAEIPRETWLNYPE